jgi:hypothetical protein
MSRLLFWRFKSFLQTVTTTAVVATWAVPSATATSGVVTPASAASAAWSVPTASSAAGTVTTGATAVSAAWVVPAAGATGGVVTPATSVYATWTALFSVGGPDPRWIDVVSVTMTGPTGLNAALASSTAQSVTMTGPTGLNAHIHP